MDCQPIDDAGKQIADGLLSAVIVVTILTVVGWSMVMDLLWFLVDWLRAKIDQKVAVSDPVRLVAPTLDVLPPHLMKLVSSYPRSEPSA